jgi:cytochrome c peroxidase
MVVRPDLPRLGGATCALFVLVLSGWTAGCVAGDDEPDVGAVSEPLTGGIGSLHGVPVPEPPDLGRYVRDRRAAVALGKAFFWEMRAGSYGQACASCHFHAGADARLKNQLNPGANNEAGAPLSRTFDPTASGAGGPNTQLGPSDFPFHRLADPNDRNSAVLFDSDDVVSSQGVFRASFAGLAAGDVVERCSVLPDVFQVGATNVRRVAARNTPSVINAAFNERNFWDGRASSHFNGVSPFGPRDSSAVVYMVTGHGLKPVHVDLTPAALASQAVGPLTNPFEMSCEGRTFPIVAQKLLALRPLALQDVDPTDSVLGPLRHPSGRGLSRGYDDLIRDAFQPPWWRSNATVSGASLLEANFSLFWGLALQLYESTLISDDSRFDRWADGDTGALTADEQLGLTLFAGKAGCAHCHRGPQLTAAALRLRDDRVDRTMMADGSPAIVDRGFLNLGVRPTHEDRGLGRLDPYGNPLSYARQATSGAYVDTFVADPAQLTVSPGVPIGSGERDGVDGAFKIPSLRNVELTAPYFHNGGTLTLEDVVRFYNRGGDRRGSDQQDTTGFGPNASNAPAHPRPLGLSAVEQAALVAFLKALTDERVRWEKAPFDHPSLRISNGAVGDTAQVATDGSSGHAADDALLLPAVGALGRAAKGLGPIQ